MRAGRNEIFKYEANPSTGYASDFIVELKDSGRAMKWDEAMHTYGRRLPDIYQAYIMAKYKNSLNAAIISFGGDKDPTWAYWTRTEFDSSSAWGVHMYSGNVYCTYKTSASRVRAVAPVPVASAK